MPRNVQERYYDDDVDYRHGSPHLVHLKLYDRLVGTLRQRIAGLAEQGLPLRVLEIGAGHGGFTEPALAAGCSVTAVEMSAPAVQELQRRFATNSQLRVLHDADGDLAAAGEGYGLILAVSVLHHIPDYESFVAAAVERLVPGGAFLSLQDPLWYSRHPDSHRRDQLGYYAWRLAQGDLGRAASTGLRRLRGVHDESSAADMVEYHVVRQGVDEQALQKLLEPRFEHVRVLPYWSNQLRLAQRFGERSGWANMFGIDAHGFRG
jgi:SAM-dependent methyltransferase